MYACHVYNLLILHSFSILDVIHTCPTKQFVDFDELYEERQYAVDGFSLTAANLRYTALLYRLGDIRITNGTRIDTCDEGRRITLFDSWTPEVKTTDRAEGHQRGLCVGPATLMI